MRLASGGKGRIPAAGAALLLFAAVSAGEPRDLQLSDDVQVSLVEVPVHVTLNGEPVRDLTVDNFRVFDRGKEVPIVSCDVIDLSMETMRKKGLMEPQISIAARRHFLLLFDLAFSDPASVHRAREAVRRWALNALHPWDLVAVAVYDEKNGAGLLLNFTTDREQIDRAIRSIGNPGFLVGSVDPLGLEVGAVRSDVFVEADTARTGNTKENDPSGGRAGESAMEAMATVYYSVHEPLKRHGERHFISSMTESLRSLARMMAGVSGRKQVIYLSGGFDNSLVFASSDQKDIDFINQAREHGEYWKIDQTKRFGSAPVQKKMSDMVQAFRRADCVIQAIDITGRRRLSEEASLSGRGTDSLFYLAHETGGELIKNLDNIDQALSEIMKRTSVTYMLSFQPKDLRPDGKYHKLKVKLKDAPKKARLNHRPGYFAPTPYASQARITQKNSAAETLLSGEEKHGLDLTVLAAPFAPLQPPRAFVPVFLELSGAGLLQGNPGDNLDLEVYVYALDRDGGIGDFLSREMRFDLARYRDRIESRGMKFYGDLALPPGDYSLRVLARNRVTGITGSRALELNVPGFQERTPVLLPPLFPEEAGKWVLVHNSRDDGKPYPFMFGERPFMPSAHPRLFRESQSELFLVGYHLDRGEGALTAQLLDRSGRVAAEPDVRLLDLEDPAADGREVLRVALRLGAVEAGEYRLRFELGGEAGGTFSALLPVQVVAESEGKDGEAVSGPFARFSARR